jgi:competence protein ComEC
VVGRFDVGALGDWREGSPVARSASRVRDSLRRVADGSMGAADGSLFTGLAIGDDGRQPAAMVTAFRDSGLSHLTAVSGQNVAFVVAAASPLFRRLRAVWRWFGTCALIAWFMAVTQFEPSVLRAGFMAIIATTSMIAGRPIATVRVLACAVTLLELIDPMLVWSVGFWLSTGATAGVCLLAPRLAATLPGPSWLSAPLSVTVAAQAGVAVPSLLIFGRLPFVSLPANLLAVPVAGFVMLVGIPAGLVAAAVPPLAGLVMLPCLLATRWVAVVAYVGAALEPPPRWSVAGWCVLVVVIVYVARRHRARVAADVPI